MVTLNFAGVQDQVSFEPIPAGKYVLQLVDYKEGTVQSESSKNYGATKFDFTFEVVGPDSVPEKLLNKKIFDNVTLVQNSLWRLKAMLKAFGVEVPEDDDIELEFDDFIGEQLEAKVKITPARKDPNDPSKEYAARNAIASFVIPEGAE
jgi:hypothetical protein